jgi:hypothetical protein
VKAVKRAKTVKGKLFRDQAFYLTAHVKQMEILRNVILANGGQVTVSVQTRGASSTDARNPTDNYCTAVVAHPAKRPPSPCYFMRGGRRHLAAARGGAPSSIHVRAGLDVRAATGD